MGHSFGARLVAYSLAGLRANQTGAASPIKSLALIQGAFSHWWYPAASMLANQDSESATDLVYRWGAMGHDGYQQNPSRSAWCCRPPVSPTTSGAQRFMTSMPMP
jgi:hypothetical protein